MDKPKEYDSLEDPTGEIGREEESEDREQIPEFDEQTRDQAPQTEQPTPEE